MGWNHIQKVDRHSPTRKPLNAKEISGGGLHKCPQIPNGYGAERVTAEILISAVP